MATGAPPLPWTTRAADLGLSALAAAVWGPVALLLVWTGGPPRIRRALRVRRDGGLFVEQRFELPGGRLGRLAGALGVHRLPTLVNVLRGELSWVGPRALRPYETDPRDADLRRRDEAPAGLLGLWRVRQLGNVAHGTELESDLEYVAAKGTVADAGLLARAAAMRMLAGGNASPAPGRLVILGQRIDNLTMAETLARVGDWLRSPEPRQLAFVNADCLNQAQGRPGYAELLREADLVLADGSGVRLAGALLEQRVRENVNGTDRFPRLCALIEQTGQGLYLLGGRPGVADDVAAWVAARYPGVTLAGRRDGFFGVEEEPAVARAIRDSGAALLLVALGAPKQDEWIRRNLAASGARVAIGVGGLFDFYSGRVPRAPGWLRELGLEWVYRFIQEPGRMWKRYWVGNFVFVARVLRERLRGRKARFARHPEEEES